MHGRVKVRSSEEEKLRKEKERQEKLKVYQHAMAKIQSKRKEGELDKEILDITEKVLAANPDISTLWNIRRETLIKFRQDDLPQEELSTLFDVELRLTEYCLKVNPKSYCAWHHREWVLTTRHDPDWKKELALCEKYLSFDERNFHTWDYRRFVVSHSKPPLKGEFDFTTEKLYENFSNYSAWHYRSKMLVALYPDLDEGRPIEESHHKRELELVLNAAFTDPDDTSAWFYQRWLLGAVRDQIQLVVCKSSQNKFTIAFNKRVDANYVKERVRIDGRDNLVWTSCTGNYFDNLWIYSGEGDIQDVDVLKVELDLGDGEKQELVCRKNESGALVGKRDVSFRKVYAPAVTDELNTQLASCRQLLQLEPDNRWTLLTTTVFLHCIDPVKYHEETISNLKLLMKLDKLRAGYYNDLLTKWSLEDQITKDYKQNTEGLRITCNDKITSLPHLQYYSHCESADLSDQQLNSNVLPTLVALQHCKVLNLENNNIQTLKDFPDLRLQLLNMKGNNVDNEEMERFVRNASYTVIY